MLVRKQQQFWYSLHIIIIVLLFVSIMYLLLLLPTCLLCDSNKKLRYYNSKCSIILISCINMLCLLLPPATGAWPTADKSFLCHSSILEPYLNLGFIELNSGGNFNSSKSGQVLVQLKLLLQLGQLIDGKKGASVASVSVSLVHIQCNLDHGDAWRREG